MKRREFITLVGGAAAAWPLAARAQQGDRVRRIGVLMALVEGDLEGRRYIEAFEQGLRELDWTQGRNLQIDCRWGGNDRDRIQAYANEFVGMKPDVILAQTSLVMPALQRATRTIPIIFMQINNPVESGIVASMARPGGNITGFMSFELTVGEKWLETLKEIAPGLTRAGVILNPTQSPQVAILRTIEAVAPAAGVSLTLIGAQDEAEIERAISAFARDSNGGLIVLPNPITNRHRKAIAALAVQYRLPAVYAYRYFVEDGGLMSYGAEPPGLYRRAANYVDRILRGEKPGDLPVQAPTKYDLVINLKAAKAIGLAISESLLVRADGVIE
jgi:putative ABC transport system substrate-binding protein